MFSQPRTIQEKRAVKFGVDLLTKYGYKRVISIPVMELTAELNEKGCKISHPTVMQYFKALERLGYIEREMQARMWGVTYRLKKYPFQKLIDA